MKVIGGEDRLKELTEEHKCTTCNGSGLGEMYYDGFGNVDMRPCDDCGGRGDTEEWRKFLEDITIDWDI